jgi:hypothetical protein
MHHSIVHHKPAFSPLHLLLLARINKSKTGLAIVGLGGDKVIVEVVVQKAKRGPVVRLLVPALEHHVVVRVRTLEDAVLRLLHAVAALYLVQHLASRHTCTGDTQV